MCQEPVEQNEKHEESPDFCQVMRLILLFRKYVCRVNPFPKQALVLRVCKISLLKTLQEKEKLLVTGNFSFSQSVLYPFGELSAIFYKLENIVCKLFQFGRI